MSTSTKTDAVQTTQEVSAFEALLDQEFKPKSDVNRAAVKTAVQTLAEQALQGAVTMKDDVFSYIQGLIEALDKKLSRQLNKVMHHPDFTKLEGTWRGLHHLVFNTETDTTLKIRIMNISKDDLRRTFAKFPRASWDQSPIFKKVYEEEFGQPGGEPFGCLIGDYEFDQTDKDIAVLGSMSNIAAAAHCPFISAASPKLLNMESWQELGDPRQIAKQLETPEHIGWKSLRNSEDSRYLGLCMPRFLSRLPYSTEKNPVDSFAFEEEADGQDHRNFVWSNSAYAMGVNINRAFKLYGWCARIRGVESGGAVENLPVHTFPTDDGKIDMKCPTEIGISDRREAELAKAGLMPLSHWKNTDFAVFVGAQSVQKPAVYEDKDATANANLSARLPYMFACCRFAHYLKCMVRDKVGSFKERHEMESWLNDWLYQFKADSANASEEIKCQRPLADGEVKVQEDQENPGYYKSQFYLRPHFQLEGLTVSLRLVSKIPSEKLSG